MIIPSLCGGADVGSLHFLLTPLLRQYDSVERLCSAMCYLNVIKVQHNYPIQPRASDPYWWSLSSLSTPHSACSLTFLLE